MSIFSKFKDLFDKILFISKFTYVKNKTIRILASILLANLSVALDILIIITFSNILIGEISYENSLILLIIDFPLAVKAANIRETEALKSVAINSAPSNIVLPSTYARFP